MILCWHTGHRSCISSGFGEPLWEQYVYWVSLSHQAKVHTTQTNPCPINLQVIVFDSEAVECSWKRTTVQWGGCSAPLRRPETFVVCCNSSIKRSKGIPDWGMLQTAKISTYFKCRGEPMTWIMSLALPSPCGFSLAACSLLLSSTNHKAHGEEDFVGKDYESDLSKSNKRELVLSVSGWWVSLSIHYALREDFYFFLVIREMD